MVEKAKTQLKNLINKTGSLIDVVKNFIATNKTVVRITTACVVFLGTVVIALAVSGVSVGLKVIYDGNEKGVIKGTSDFNGAKELAVSSVDGAKESDFYFDNFKLQKVLTLKSRMSSVYDIAQEIIDANNDVVYATEVLVDGQPKLYVKDFDVEAYINLHLEEYDVDGAQNAHEFVDNVDIKKAYCLSDDLSNLNEVTSFIDSLDVKTTSVVVSNEYIPYSTVTEKTSMQYVGYSSVVSSGVKGVLQKRESIVSVNGVKVSDTEVSREVISEPVDEVVLVGTKKYNSNSAKKLGFIFPLPKGSWKQTSYYGEGRNHQGLDFGADRGTSIYSVKSGTVTFASSNGNYGYCVIVDHGNGLKTLYAHADKILVSKGEKVEAGQIIATVGNTGRSTGNHLHFEVIINGSNVNPTPYLGLG